MNTTTNRKPPTKAEAMKVLIEMERKLMVKENEEAKAAKQLAEEELTKATIQYVLDNFDSLKANLQLELSSWQLMAGVSFKTNSQEKALTPIPPHLKKLHKKWDDIDDNPHGWNVDRIPERDIRKRIEDKLKRVNASAVINGTNCAQVERTPVIKEYLEEFLASLNKASKAAERLAA